MIVHLGIRGYRTISLGIHYKLELIKNVVTDILKYLQQIFSGWTHDFTTKNNIEDHEVLSLLFQRDGILPIIVTYV